MGKALAVGDLDRDGAPDLVTAGWRGPGDPFVRTWLSTGACPGATVKLPLQATGARATVDDGPAWWLAPSTTFSSSAPELYLGLPEADTATLSLTLARGTAGSPDKVTCPAGLEALGGGCSGAISLQLSQPLSRGWRCTPGSTAYVLCADVNRHD